MVVFLLVFAVITCYTLYGGFGCCSGGLESLCCGFVCLCVPPIWFMWAYVVPVVVFSLFVVVLCSFVVILGLCIS